MATKIISETIKPGRCLKLRVPSDWRHIDLSKDLFDTIFIDDIFGAGALNEQLLKGWTTFLPDLEQAVRKKKIAVVITTRHYILEEAREKMRRLNLFKDEKVQLLTSSELTQSERTDILEAHLKHSNRQFGSTLIEDCNISYNTSFRNLHYQFPDHVSETGELSEYLRAGKWTRIRAMVGFPEIAHLFSNNDQVFQRGASFFEQPLTFFRKCMEDLFLDEEKFLSLILVWARPDQKLQILEFNEIEMSNEISMTAKRFGFKLKGKLLRLLKKSLNYHKDGFLKFEPQTGIYSFCHNIVKDMVGLVAGQEFPDEVLEYASEDFIMQYVTTDQEKNDGFHILIDEFRFSKLNSVICKLLMRKPSPTEVIYELLPLDFEIAKICSVERTNVPDMPMELGEDTMNTSVLKHDCFANKAYVVRFLESNMGRNILPTSSLTITGQFGYYGIDFGEQKIQVFLPSHALLYGNFVLLEEFLKKEFSSVIKNTSEFLYVSLLLASHQGMTNIVEMLLTYGATVNEDAIFIAAEKQHDDTLNCLLEARGENYITQSNIINKNSPLIAAAKKGATLSVQTLINHGVDIEYRNSNNMTAFEKAILYKRPDVCKILLESGAPVNYKTGKFKRTPLHINADVGGKNITELLLQHGASVNARDYRGHYPIQCAAIRGNKHIVDTLLKWDKSQALFRLRSYGKKSVLNGMDLVHIAVWKQNPELLDVLIENNVNVNARDFYGRTPFYRAVFQHFTYLYDSEDEFEENSEIIKRLLNVADVQQPEKNGFTPLHAAIHKGHTNVAKLICPQANVNAQDRFGKTALHTACEKFNFEMFKTLVEEFNADVRMLTKKGKTVMHILAEQTNLMRIHSRTMKLGEMGKVPLEVRYYLVVQRSPLLKNFESVVARKNPEFALRWASYSNQYFSH
ncbi:uncharacterized protein LOC123563868 [Mercenaria mercenaria]|uniref:uncharacterized protein LOC123563868 n=1 Tax=Mercenaria mercenaria TaxID=6596 RepID=UPI00234E5BB3|nr:uncharacterized protein LOC123563868 [Mercenaria mercenaria]